MVVSDYSGSGIPDWAYRDDGKRLRGCAYTGIFLRNSSANILDDNTVTGWYAGIISQNHPDYYYSKNQDDHEYAGNTISGNLVNDNHYGLYLSGRCYYDYDPVGANIITGNTISNNREGIWITGSSIDNQITGNDILNNVSEAGGSGIHLGYGTSGNIINLNRIIGNSPYGVYNDPDNEIAIATSNWWGHHTGPYHDNTNLGGLGDAVSDNVLFDPWLLTDPKVKTTALTVSITTDLADSGLKARAVSYLVISPEPLINKAFVTDGTSEDLAKAKAAYQAALKAFNELRGTLSDDAKGRALVDLSVAKSAILALEIRLLSEAGEAYDLADLIRAYQVAVANLAAYSQYLESAQIAAINEVLEAVAAVIARH